MPWRWCSTPGTCGELKTVKAFPSDGESAERIDRSVFLFLPFFPFLFLEWKESECT